MVESRKRERKKLSATTAEISLLEKEKEMGGKAMVEVEDEDEIKKRSKIRKITHHSPKPQPKPLISQPLLHSFNRFFFEAAHLPLEYVLLNSTKMVLTREWYISIVEKEWVEKIEILKDLADKRQLLEQKSETQSNTDQTSTPNARTNRQLVPLKDLGSTRRKILNQTKRNRDLLSRVGNSLLHRADHSLLHRADHSLLHRTVTGASLKPNTSSPLFASLSVPYVFHFVPDVALSPNLEVTPDQEKEIKQKYMQLLSLFSLMKANKSTVRFSGPHVGKKSNPVIHSSHIACVEKIRAEVGKITTIPELAKYRQTKKIQQDHRHKNANISLHRTQRHAIPIMCPTSQPTDKEKKPKRDSEDV